METIKWYQSKVIWIAVGTIVVGVVPLAVTLISAVAPDALTFATAIGAFIVGVINIILRVGTDREIE
jgi:hypothetical protein